MASGIRNQYRKPGILTAAKRLVQALPYLRVLRPRRGGELRNLFDADFYRAANPDLPKGISPLLHFIAAGAFEGRQPHPLFDPAFYLRTYPDVSAAKVNPLGHFLRYGGTEGRLPHPLFDSAFYLDRYPDVRKTGMNPLVHFVLYGAAEGRKPHTLFQPDYYLSRCPEARSSKNPLLYFLSSNVESCGNPHLLFDCEYYLDRHPDLAVQGINPLVHYVLARHDIDAGTEGSCLFEASITPGDDLVDEREPASC